MARGGDAGVTYRAGAGEIEVSAGDPEDFDALLGELRGVAGIVVRPVPVPSGPGEQGSVVDLLTVACSGGAITVFLQIIKTLVESRGPGFRLRIRRGRDRLEITAADVDEALPMLRDLLDGS
jgi:hypothetical protein